MNLALIQLLLGLGGGLAQSLIPGKNGEKIGQITSSVGLLLGQADSFLQDEAKLRGISIDQLRATLLAELDKSIPQTGENIKVRIDHIKNTPEPVTATAKGKLALTVNTAAQRMQLDLIIQTAQAMRDGLGT